MTLERQERVRAEMEAFVEWQLATLGGEEAAAVRQEKEARRRAATMAAAAAQRKAVCVVHKAAAEKGQTTADTQEGAAAEKGQSLAACEVALEERKSVTRREAAGAAQVVAEEA